MKKLLILPLVSFFSFFGLFGNSTNTLENNSIYYGDDDTIILTFKAQSSDVMAIKHEIEYNTEEFTLEEVIPNSYFNYEYKDTNGENNIVTKTVLFDSVYAFDSIEYMKLKLKPKDNITEGTIKIDKIEFGNSDHKLVKPNGSLLTLKISGDDLSVYKEELIMQNVIVKTIREHKKTSIAFCIAVIALIIIKNIAVSIFKATTKKRKYFTDMKEPVDKEEKRIEEQEGIELIREVEKEEKENPISDDIFKGKYEIFILLFLVGSLLMTTHVFAKTDNAKDIRNAIINQTYSEDLDYNKDKKINVIDLVYAIEPEEIVNKGNINFK